VLYHRSDPDKWLKKAQLSLSDPPFGVEWRTQQKKVTDEHEILDFEKLGRRAQGAVTLNSPLRWRDQMLLFSLTRLGAFAASRFPHHVGCPCTAT
jgi:hypothetical protein